MGAFKDLTGQRFGKLLVISRSGRNANKCITWDCVCDCGKGAVVTGISMSQGNRTSCGCVHYSNAQKFKDKYGDSIKYGFAAQEYSIWLGIKKRCYNTKAHAYPLYGGRGVKVYDGWVNDFTEFFEYLGPRPSPEHSVDRIDSNGHYEPGNVRWATNEEQSRRHCLHSTNSTGTSNVTFRVGANGITTCVAEVSLSSGRKKLYRVNKSLSVNKYGLLPAMAMAIEWREEEMLKLQESGIIYAESHGTQRKVIND